MHDDPLQTPVQFISGVGPQRAELLQKIGLRTAEDVLLNLPRDYIDLTVVRPVSELVVGEFQTVRGRVVDLDARALSGNKTLSAVLLDCDGEYLRGVWFNQKWILGKFQPGDLVLFSAKAKQNAGRWEMSHPRIQWLDEEEGDASGGILPCYPLTEGLKMDAMRRIAKNTVETFSEFVVELLPPKFRDYASLIGIREAIRFTHFLDNSEQQESARRRLIFQDLLEFQLGLALRRRLHSRRPTAARIPATAKIDSRIRRLFPFAFTEGQNRALTDIIADLNSGRPMHRLLQADVGAGKNGGRHLCHAAGHRCRTPGGTHGPHGSSRESTLGYNRPHFGGQPSQSRAADR